MAGEPETPDTIPFVSPETVALARRIERAMRICFVFVAPTELDAQAYTDMKIITDGVNDGVRRGEKRPAAARSARITWLAGVLAGAMGERNTRENHDGK
jgi:hypothetical protein